MARSAILNVMVQAAMKAGRSLARDFGEVQNLQVSLKGPGDYVSQADRKAEEIIHTELSRARPGYAFLMEERGAVAGDDDQHRWIVDPLDGTTNFLHGLPIFSISIALERQGQIVAGVIYNPAMDELYTAERGGGAFMNDRRLRVAGRTKLSDAVIGTGVPHLGRGHHGNYLVELRNVMAEVSGIRRIGSAALDLAYVAAGRMDGFWEEPLAPWDVAAGILLIREAGGFVSDKSRRAGHVRHGPDRRRQRGDPPRAAEDAEEAGVGTLRTAANGHCVDASAPPGLILRPRRGQIRNKPKRARMIEQIRDTVIGPAFWGRFQYSRAELIADGIVHAVGIVLAIAAGSALLVAVRLPRRAGRICRRDLLCRFAADRAVDLARLQSLADDAGEMDIAPLRPRRDLSADRRDLHAVPRPARRRRGWRAG